MSSIWSFALREQCDKPLLVMTYYNPVHHMGHEAFARAASRAAADERSRTCCGVPLALGLGISNPEQCRQAAELADGVVVGSGLVKAAMDAMEDGEDPALRAGELARDMKAAIK